MNNNSFLLNYPTYQPKTVPAVLLNMLGTVFLVCFLEERFL